MKRALLFALLVGCGSTPSQNPTDGGMDAAIADASTDVDSASADADSSTDAGPTRVACGGGYCRADEQCSNGACVVTCKGSTVPGDYATLGEALTALTQTDATICLAAQTYDETASAYSTQGKALTIIGPPAAKVTSLSVAGDYSSVTLRGFSATMLQFGATSSVDVIGVRASTVLVENAQKGAMLFDGCDLGDASHMYGLQVQPGPGVSISVQNTWIHAASSCGVYFYAYPQATGSSLSLVSDTFVGNVTAIDFETASGSTLTYANDIIANNTGVAVYLSGVSSPTHDNNLVYGNATNYGGTAVDGVGYVKADPMLDNGTPPAPKSGSPARGAADAAKAPKTDYWGSVRGGAPDLGAVQGS
jgi:hypothetical protein